jgi:CDP-diacylglycerol--glycerol-3-phosphate 3-phosphatidyltransferase
VFDGAMKNLANILTVFRLFLLPVIILLLFKLTAAAAWAALIIYAIGAITDFFDGYVARKLNQVSEFGKFMDPISDKIYVTIILLALLAIDRIESYWVIPVMIIFIREFLVSGMREFLGPKNIQLPVTNLAKWKTTFQMLCLGFLIIGPYFPGAMIAGLMFLLSAAIITTITGWDYIKAGFKHMDA